jgi:chorismate dehydratase
LRIGKVRYLNTKPIYYGLEVGAIPKGEGWIFIENTPSVLNAMLRNKELDLSVISSVEYAQHWKEYYILPNLCIGSNGDVKSVLFFSKKPLDKLSGVEVWLTKSSLTSKTLVKWILEEKGAKPIYREFTLGEEVFLNDHTEAILLIGDEALKKRESGVFPYCTDLGAYWQSKTGLPFVFALWCVRREIALKEPNKIEEAWRKLLASREYSARKLNNISQTCYRQTGLTSLQCYNYLTGLNFDLTPIHIEGMNLFFSILVKKGFIPSVPPLEFFPKEEAL